MSFSGDIKDELLFVMGNSRHCQMAELAAYFQFCSRIATQENDNNLLKIQTENKIVARKCFTLLKKTFKIYVDVTVRRSGVQTGNTTYVLRLDEHPLKSKVTDALKMQDWEKGACTSALLLKNGCCKRAFLRGVYLAAGSVSDPYKSYHMELVCQTPQQALQMQKLLSDFGMESKITQRKKHHVVYMKDSENIADFLNVIEAHRALMEFENARIYKEVRNTVNRQMNCDSANINKIVTTANRQVEDIKYIREVYGLEKLPDTLREMAYVRLENPDAPLGELGKLLDPPVGKSGVNHRLRKLGEFAKSLRD